MGSGDAGTVLWIVGVGLVALACAVSVWVETSDVAGVGEVSCSDAEAMLSLVEAGPVGASACTGPDSAEPCDVVGTSATACGWSAGWSGSVAMTSLVGAGVSSGAGLDDACSGVGTEAWLVGVEVVEETCCAVSVSAVSSELVGAGEDSGVWLDDV